jgi:hypothetical protein
MLLILVAVTVYAVRQCSVEHINHTMPALAEHQKQRRLRASFLFAKNPDGATPVWGFSVIKK